MCEDAAHNTSGLRTLSAALMLYFLRDTASIQQHQQLLGLDGLPLLHPDLPDLAGGAAVTAVSIFIASMVMST